MENKVDTIRYWLEDAQEEEVLSTIVMILEFYMSKYKRDLNKVLDLIKRGYFKYKQLLNDSE